MVWDPTGIDGCALRRRRQLVELVPDGCHFLCKKGSKGISSEVGSWGRRRRVEQSFEGGE